MENTKTPGEPSRNGAVPFGEATITHRLLDQTHRTIMRTVHQPAGFTFLLIYGPTGVGKTRMITSLHRDILAMGSPEPASLHRVLTISADPPDGSAFNRGYFYQTLLTRLGEKTYPLQVQIASHADHSPLKRRRLPKAAINSNDIPELREATKEAIPRHGLEILIMDEAHHMLYAGDGAQGSILQEQLVWLKSLSIAAPNMLYILVGTYDLLNFGRLNGELSRRCQPIHFPRYQLQREEDCVEFQAALFHLLQKVPLQVDAATLVKDYWLFFYERSVGCIGILKDWLLRAVSTALSESKDTLTLDWLQDHALQVEQCQQMMIDATEGEQKLNYTEANREHLWRLLQGGELIAPVPPLPPRGELPCELKPVTDTPTSLVPDRVAPLPDTSPEEAQAQIVKKTRTRKKPKENPPNETVQEGAVQTTAGEASLAPEPPKRRRKKITETVGENGEVAGLAPSESLLEVPILHPPKRQRKKTEASVGENTEVEGQSPSDGNEHAPALDTPKRRRKKSGDPVAENVEAEVKAASSANGEASSAQVDAESPVSPTKPKRTRRVGEPKPKRYPVGERVTEQGA